MLYWLQTFASQGTFWTAFGIVAVIVICASIWFRLPLEGDAPGGRARDILEFLACVGFALAASWLLAKFH